MDVVEAEDEVAGAPAAAALAADIDEDDTKSVENRTLFDGSNSDDDMFGPLLSRNLEL